MKNDKLVWELGKWEEFYETINSIIKKYGSYEEPRLAGETLNNPVLFRGQRNAKWEIKTTLERISKDEFDIEKYMDYATEGRNEIESITGKEWKREKDIRGAIKKYEEENGCLLPGYNYLVYLRHHGFPSPLLDWTKSPYIAAFFAFSEICNEEQGERVAIYVYIDDTGEGKTGWASEARIFSQGSRVTTDIRHFAQKACYTIANVKDVKDCRRFFCSHHEVFNKDTSGGQEILLKITLPCSERKKALKELDNFNINYFTLFQSEDSLIKTMAMRKFDF